MEEIKPANPTTELVHAAGGRMPDEPGGSVRAALANAMVGMKKQHYGRGPTAGKAWLLDDYVFVALEGGLTRSEETLLADGKEEEVRRYRLSFQETMGETVMEGGGRDHRPAGADLPQPDRLRSHTHLRDLRARAAGAGADLARSSDLGRRP
jgi:hypothetical protein